jgi:hypothetical protein
VAITDVTTSDENAIRTKLECPKYELWFNPS